MTEKLAELFDKNAEPRAVRVTPALTGVRIASAPESFAIAGVLRSWMPRSRA
jgi:hypothetical protein